MIQQAEQIHAQKAQYKLLLQAEEFCWADEEFPEEQPESEVVPTYTVLVRKPLPERRFPPGHKTAAELARAKPPAVICDGNRQWCDTRLHLWDGGLVSEDGYCTHGWDLGRTELGGPAHVHGQRLLHLYRPHQFDAYWRPEISSGKVAELIWDTTVPTFCQRR